MRDHTRHRLYLGGNPVIRGRFTVQLENAWWPCRSCFLVLLQGKQVRAAVASCTTNKQAAQLCESERYKTSPPALLPTSLIVFLMQTYILTWLS